LDSPSGPPIVSDNTPQGFATAQIAQTLRILRGRNKALLVKANDGRQYVQKFPDAATHRDLLFNEAFASQLGTALDLSFPRWSELIDSSGGHRSSSFGSELISGEILEYLPGGWYQNVENRSDAYRCLLFDLWCNHADSRQVVFQKRSARVFHVYFFDHDQMFSPHDETCLPKRIARTRCLDLRIYKQPFGSIVQDLRQLAGRIRRLTRYALLRRLESNVPATWGSIAHRKRTMSGLEHRSGQLNTYIEAIAQFAQDIR
jgi:hypothetical protein